MYIVRDVVIESLVVIRYRVYFYTWSREFLIFQAWIRETSLRRDAFLDHFCVNMLAAWLNFVACRKVNFSRSRVSNFQNFLGGMPQTPLEGLGPMVKVENTFILQWDPWPIQTLICPPPPCKFWNMAFVGTFFKLYALICYIRINSVPPLPNYLPCDNWKKKLK